MTFVPNLYMSNYTISHILTLVYPLRWSIWNTPRHKKKLPPDTTKKPTTASISSSGRENGRPSRLLPPVRAKVWTVSLWTVSTQRCIKTKRPGKRSHSGAAARSYCGKDSFPGWHFPENVLYFLGYRYRRRRFRDTAGEKYGYGTGNCPTDPNWKPHISPLQKGLESCIIKAIQKF